MATSVVLAAPKAALLSSEQLEATKKQKRQLKRKLRDSTLAAIDREQLRQELEATEQKLEAHFRAEFQRNMTCFV